VSHRAILIYGAMNIHVTTSHRAARPVTRRLGALLTALAGVMNIVSALCPTVPARMEILSDILPLTVIRGAQSATVLVGFALILVADGLRKRRRRALQIAVMALLLSALFHLTKGLDFEEAIVALSIAWLLTRERETFNVPSRMVVPGRLFSHVHAIVVLYVAYVVVGFAILRREVMPPPSMLHVVEEPFRLLGDAAYYHYLTPQARWFERSTTGFACCVALYVVLRVLRPLIPNHSATTSERARARRLVEAYGSDTLAYFSLQDGRSYFFDESKRAFVSYRIWRNVALVAGDPVGPPECHLELVRSFLQFTVNNGLEPCFLGVPGTSLHLYRSLGMGSLKVGEEAVIDLAQFELHSLKRKVRRAARHISDLKIAAAVYRRDEVPPHIMDQVRDISRAWVRDKGGSERGFSMTLGRLPRAVDKDCELIVAQQGDKVFGFLSLTPVYQGNAWSLDSMRRRPESPNGLMEFLVIAAAENYAARGSSRLSLNFATLSNAANDIESRAIDETRRFLFDHLSSFYQLKSLYQFNNKFAPDWCSRYLTYRDVLKIPRLALAIAQSEDPIRLPTISGMLKREV
jgi:phosphatidylglycerol lysyltransferase